MSLDKEFLERIYDKQEQIASDVGEIKVTLAKQEENLKLHIYRTELNEQNIELLRKEFHKDVEPIKTHIKYLQGIAKFVGGVALLATFVVTILKIFYYIKDLVP